MLRSLTDIESCALRATDGMIGHVRDCYFDDSSWVLRYLVVETGTWLSRRRVLISTVSLQNADWARKSLPVSITRQQVRDSPDIDTDKPVSRQHEVLLHGHYGYRQYWVSRSYSALATHRIRQIEAPRYDGAESESQSTEATRARAESIVTKLERQDPHLRSGNAIVTYHLQATDGDAGDVHGALLEEDTWAIRFLIINADEGWSGHRVLIEPHAVIDLRVADETIAVSMSRQEIKDAPLYSESSTAKGE